MPHLDPDTLALLALGDSVASAEYRAHLSACPACQGELESLTSMVTAARMSGPEELVSPPPGVWNAIASDLDIGPGQGIGYDSAAQPSSDPLGTTRPGGRPARPRPVHAKRASRVGRAGRDRLKARTGPALVAIVAIIAGLIGGIAGAAIERSGQSHPSGSVIVAKLALRPLPQFPQYRSAVGSAVLERQVAGLRLTVTVHAPARKNGFFEVWLLARDGVSMISLGDLNAEHTGSFAMPPGVDLRNYSRIDVSLQAFNGNPAHSSISVVRGSMPR